MDRVLVLCVAILLVSCSDSNIESTISRSDNQNSVILDEPVEPLADEINSESLALIQQTSSISETSFAMLQAQVENLNIATKALAEKPTEQTLERARLLWPRAHDAYLATRIFRQWAEILEIVHPDFGFAQIRPNVIHTNHSRIDQHPLIPGYLDKVQGYPLSGLMHSELEISPETLNHEHSLGDKAYVAVGFHALEFMLFGEQGSSRILDDFIDTGSQDAERQNIAQRRLVYIELLGDLLREDIDSLGNAWKGETSFFQSELAKIQTDKLRTTLRQLAEVELEASAKIQEILDKDADQNVHDSADSIAARIKVAEQVLELIKPKQ